MKHLPSLFFFFLSASSILAQSQIALQNLEGRWYRTGRQEAVFTHWAFAGNQTMTGLSFTMACGDTLLLSRAEIRFDEQSARMTIQLDTAAHGRTQIFRLVRATADELFWENENPEGAPRHLGWIFFGADYVTFRADGVESDYRRAHERRMPSFQSRLHAGAGISQRRKLQKKAPFTPVQYEKQEYQAKQAFELALGIGLRGKDTPMSVYLELGYTQREIGLYTISNYNDVRYLNQGTLRYTSTYLAFVPELVFGKRNAFAINTGIYIDILTRAHFIGRSAAIGSGVPDSKMLQPGASRSTGLSLGLAYELPFAGLKALNPGVYARAAFDLGSGARLSTYSVGLRLRVGKE